MWAVASSPYWIFPLISGCVWLAMLMAMIIHWSVVGHPHYPSMDAGQTIAYISDIGAFGLKPLFITGCVITTVFLDASFISERWLRHKGTLVRNTYTSQKILSVFSIIFAVAGTCGLILLSIFDDYHYPRLHDGFLLLFIAGYVISAIFVCAEYQRLGMHYRNHRILRISFWVKLIFILVEVVFAIVFATTMFTSQQNVAAVFEWIIAFVFTFYVFSFLLDLLPSVRTKHHLPQGVREEMEQRGHRAPPGDVEYEGNLTNDSAGPNRQGDEMDDSYRGLHTPTPQGQGYGYAAPYAEQMSGSTVHDTAANGVVGKPEMEEVPL